MKKVVLMCSMAGALLLGNVSMSVAQDTIEKTDTISADSAALQIYKTEEDSDSDKGGSGKTIAIIAGVVVVAGAAGYFLLKKKK